MLTEPPKRISGLVERFERHASSYTSSGYNEAQVRQEFINILFDELGWDIYNVSGYAEAYKDVVHEDAIKVASGTKAPDYCFRIGGSRKFFLEAKRPAVKIKEDVGSAYQLRRYGWSAKLPLSVLTNFAEFAVYDCRIRPQKEDKASRARIHYWTYRDYIDKWDEISGVFSKEALLQGSFDEFVESTKRKRGTAEVDTEFLKEIEDWRDRLSRNIAIRNLDLSVDDLNYSVQRTIDRILFLRMCEDRGIEPFSQLRGLLNSDDIYAGLCQIYLKADEKYNSGLFHFRREKDRPTEPDDLTLNLSIDSKVLTHIIKHIYYPESPYEFSVWTPEILGNVYEQFLGKTIRLTPGHRAKVEYKPEVKKAGGVYYTPQFIVEYIVGETVGRACKGKTPGQISKLRILDPACGSGSFLLGAYAYLLSHHLDYYTNHNPSRRRDKIYQGRDKRWFLTIKEKKRILLTNIFGVDIDTQAVEVTKLSLLLKVLEDENKDVLEKQQKLWRERALPDLGNNIKCGNSLIGLDSYDGRQARLIADEDGQMADTFDWKTEYPNIIRSGGFDVVMGNPPYASIQTLRGHRPFEAAEMKRRYVSAQSGSFDIYVVFIERGLQLLNPSGILGYICPHKFFNAKYGEPLRRLIAEGRYLSKVVHFTDQQVFKGATTYTCLLFLDKRNKYKFEFSRVANLADWRRNGYSVSGKVSLKEVTDREWNFVVGESASVYKRLDSMETRLRDITMRIFQGVITSADPIFLFKGFESRTGPTMKVFSKKLNQWIELERGLLKPVVRSGHIDRYRAHPTAYVLFPYDVVDGKGRLLSRDEIRKDYPLVWKYLENHKDALMNREKGRFKDQQWFRFGRTQNIGMWEQKKLLVPYMVRRLGAYLDADKSYYFVNVTTGGYGITVDEAFGSYEYICALLNSKLIDFYFKHTTTTFRSGYFAAGKQFIERIPIRTIDLLDSKDKSRHDEIARLVKDMTNLNERLAIAKSPTERQKLHRQITLTDRRLDLLVYDLYGLTQEEVDIVEEFESNADSDQR